MLHLSSALFLSFFDSIKKILSCSIELLSPDYQLWYNIFFSQQNSISQLISRKNHQPFPPLFFDSIEKILPCSLKLFSPAYQP
jgi:hypothetical protein